MEVTLGFIVKLILIVVVVLVLMAIAVSIMDPSTDLLKKILCFGC